MKLIRPERKLYPLVMRWLNTQFRRSTALVDHTDRTQLFAVDISQQGIDDGGLWSRPDLAVIAYTRSKFIPYWTTSIYSFEIKTADGVNQFSVYESFAHTRYVNYSYLFWQALDELSESERRIVALCKEFEIGAITAEDPNNPNNYKVWCESKYRSINPSQFDSFITQRLSPEEQEKILNWLKRAVGIVRLTRGVQFDCYIRGKP